MSIIPQPQQIDVFGGYFVIKDEINICYSAGNEEIAKHIEENLLSLKIKPRKTGNKAPVRNTLILKTDTTKITSNEGYYLEIEKDAILIKAKTNQGLFYGYQTLKQLIIKAFANNNKISTMEIYDNPRFSWRGMHLDVCRHFMPVSFVKKYIDLLATYKFNTFHWHLTDDQGWRIEIKKYPNLTKIGSCRPETVVGHADKKPQQFDGEEYCGFYTQEEIKDIVNYANERFVTIVPEIEMPGHAQAAIASYPFLGCTADSSTPWTSWGISPYIYNVEDTTFSFLCDVISEVIDLFPSKYIHIGGDEALKDQWKNSEKVQQKMKELNLKDEHELQSYFVGRIEKFVNSKGRSIIGWDEILEGGLAPNAAVMSWRGYEGGVAAAKGKHYVVMSPTEFCYFDYYQYNPDNEPLAIGGNLPVEKVYSFEPMPNEMSAEEQKYILGAQGNVWTEYIPDSQQVEYMVLPRLLAMSEVVWSSKESKNWENFKARLLNHQPFLDQLNVNYAKHLFNQPAEN